MKLKWAEREKRDPFRRTEGISSQRHYVPKFNGGSAVIREEDIVSLKGH